MQAPLKTLNDGVVIPQIGLGTWKLTDDEAAAAVESALKAGYRHIDTAAIYKNEKGVGQAIRASGLPRDQVFVTTKQWLTDQGRKQARPALEASLDKLGLDHVDLYLIHWPCPRQGLFLEAWQQLIDFRSEGLVRSIGVSNFLPDHLDAIVDETGIAPAVNQVELHPTFVPEDVVAKCAELDVAIESWSPLGMSQDLNNPVIVEIAARLDATPAQVIIAWHLRHGHVALPKSKTPERIASNLAAAELQLRPEDVATLDRLNTGHRLGPDPAKLEPDTL